ncbi:MAG: hypothetical protein IPQ04_06125 [Saprospiraceae bacterium]|nr:hypothetical protein [Saprospiraceae bacterium]
MMNRSKFQASTIAVSPKTSDSEMSWKRCGCNASHDWSGAEQSPFFGLDFWVTFVSRQKRQKVGDH